MLTRERIERICYGGTYTLNEHTELCQMAAGAVNAEARVRQLEEVLRQCACKECKHLNPLSSCLFGRGACEAARAALSPAPAQPAKACATCGKLGGDGRIPYASHSIHAGKSEPCPTCAAQPAKAGPPITRYTCCGQPTGPFPEAVAGCDYVHLECSAPKPTEKSEGREANMMIDGLHDLSVKLEAVEADRDLLDGFMREVGAALLGPPEEGTEWGGGGIMDGIQDLKRVVEAARAVAGACIEEHNFLHDDNEDEDDEYDTMMRPLWGRLRKALDAVKP